MQVVWRPFKWGTGGVLLDWAPRQFLDNQESSCSGALGYIELINK